MAKYIDADELKRKLINKGFFPAIVSRTLEDMPSADVEEIKQGYWKKDFCSVCGEINPTTYLNESTMEYDSFYLHRCPYCGAYMKKE